MTSTAAIIVALVVAAALMAMFLKFAKRAIRNTMRGGGHRDAHMHAIPEDALQSGRRANTTNVDWAARERWPQPDVNPGRSEDWSAHQSETVARNAKLAK